MSTKLLPHALALALAHERTGDDCFVVRVAVRGMAQLEAVVDTLAAFGPVKTSVILASYPSKPISFMPE